LSTEAGKGKTPRKTPGSIATVAAERPQPAIICASKPPVECPITAGFLSKALMTSAVLVSDLLQGLLCDDLRLHPSRLNGCRIAWPIRRQRRVARLLEEIRPRVPAARQQPEPMDEDHRIIAGGVGHLDLLPLPLGN
jgi:hypothetical protein